MKRTLLLSILVLFSGYSIAQTCTVDNLNDGGDEVAVWLMSGPYADSYVFDGSGTFTQNEDGTALLTGTVIGTDTGNQLDLVVNFENGSSWSEWSALGRSYKDEPGIVGDNYLDYTYYEMSSSSTMTLNGGEDVLTLNHAPANYYYGFQVGVGANATTAVPGLGGWFTYESGQGGGQGDILLEGDCPLATPPDNDLCADAAAIACGDVVAGTTLNATTEDLEFCGTSLNTSGGVWYTFVGTGGEVTASTCNDADFDTKIGAFTGSCEQLVCAGGLDDTPGCSGFTQEFTWLSEAGTTYYLYVTGFGSASGNFNLSITCAEDLEGCTDPEACNYNPDATVDDGSCEGTAVWYIPTEVGGGPAVLSCDAPDGYELADQDCAQTVVDNDSFCVNTSFDGICYDAYDACLAGPCDALPASISTTSETTICADDGEDDLIDVSIDDAGAGSNSAYVITDADLTILGIAGASPINLEGAGAGTCLIWYLNFEDDLTGAEVGANAADLGGCFALSNPITITRLTGDDCPTTEVPGCTDETACNYNPDATTDDGSCEYGLWYIPAEVGGGPALIACSAPDGYELADQDCAAEVVGNDPFCGATSFDGICFNAYNLCLGLGGCTDDTACNYDADAAADDGSCVYATGCDECDGAGGVIDNPEIGDACDDGDDTTINDVYTTCDICEGESTENPGCTDPTACNYDADATTDDGSCDYSGQLWYIPAEVGGGPAVLTCGDAPDGYELADQVCAAEVVAADPFCVNTSFDGICYNAYDECLGIVDCPDLALNIGDPCDDGDETTENDAVSADCVCVGTPIGVTPENDLCADATPIACGDALAGSTTNATADESLGTCGTILTTAGGVWYSFVGTGQDVTASTCDAADYDTKIGVFTGACDALECVAGNDDGAGCTGFTSLLTWTAEEGTAYSIYVSGWNANVGNFTLSLTCVDETFDCPDLSLNIGDACDDGDANTVNDTVTADCLCVGESNETPGCTDETACNYNPDATTDDGSCDFSGQLWYIPAEVGGGPAVLTCGDAPVDYVLADQVCAAEVVAADAFCGTTSFDGICFGAYDECLGIVDCPDLALNIGDPCDDGDETTENDTVSADCLCIGESTEVPGCTDATASNYDPDANVNDGSCLYLCDTDPADLLTVSTWTGFDDGSGLSYGNNAGMGLLDGANNAFGGNLWNVVTAGVAANEMCVNMDFIVTGDASAFPKTLEFRLINDGTPNVSSFNMVAGGPGTYNLGGIVSTGVPGGAPFDPDGQTPALVAAIAHFEAEPLVGNIDVVFSNLCLSTDCAAGEILGCTDLDANNYNPAATADDGSCLYDVVFNVDMNCYDGNDPDIETNAPYTGAGLPGISGPFCGWCNDIFMTEIGSTGVWTVTLSLPLGPTEYKYWVDGFAGQEQLVDNENDGCVGVFAPPFANRVIEVIPGSIADEVYGSCDACVPFDCPDLSANIGDACDDDDANTVDDVVGSDCVCAGTPDVAPCAAGEGLEGVIVETYYVADAADASNTVFGNSLAEGAVTYRIYVDMAPGYELETVFGIGGSPLVFATTSEFYNSPLIGQSNGGLISSSELSNSATGLNTLALDSWLTFGLASDNHVGTPKALDPDGSFIGGANTADGLLANDDPSAGIPISSSDGLVPGTVTGAGFNAIGDVGAQAASLFGSSNASGTFSTENGAYATLGGSEGTNDENHILIGQITTDGVFSFSLNFRLGASDGSTEDYLHTECDELTFSSDGEGFVSIETLGALLKTYPNPNSGESISIQLDNMPGEGEEVIIELIDAFGHSYPMTIFDNEDDSSLKTLDFVSELSNGLYIITVRYNNTIITEKIVISK